MISRKAIVAVMTAMITAAILSGCSTATAYKDNKQNVEDGNRAIMDAVLNDEYSQVIILDQPPIKTKEFDPIKNPNWLSEKTMLSADKLPFSLVLREIVGDKVQIEYGTGIDVARSTSIFMEGGTKREALNVLGNQTDYGIEVAGNKVTVNRFVSKTFYLPTVTGSYNIQIGSDGGSTGSTQDALEGSASSTGGGDGQFGNLKANDYNTTTHVMQGVTSILKGETDVPLGQVEQVLSLSAVIVRTSPSVMREVDQFVDSVIKSIERQVKLEITVIQYTSSDESEFGADIDLAINSANASLGLTTTAPSLTNTITPATAAFEQLTGDFAGSKAVIRALSTTGRVGVTTSNRVFAANHKLQEIDLSKVEEYISETTVSYEGSDGDIPNYSITKAVTSEGVKMMVLPTITDSYVMLSLNGTLTKANGFKDDEIGSITVRSPRTTTSKFNLTGRFRFNETFLVTHLRQQSDESQETSYMDIPTGVKGAKAVTNTLVLLTPRRVTEF